MTVEDSLPVVNLQSNFLGVNETGTDDECRDIRRARSPAGGNFYESHYATKKPERFLRANW